MRFLKVSLICTLVLNLNLTQSLCFAQDSSNKLNFKVYDGQEENSNNESSAQSDSSDGAKSQDKQVNLFKATPQTDTVESYNQQNNNVSQESTDKSADSSSPSKDKAQDITTKTTDDSSATDTTSQAKENTATKSTNSDNVASTDADNSATSVSDTASQAAETDKTKIANKVLQGYVRVVPLGTKIPIIMDTAIDSDTSQESDEFSARTAEDLNIDGQTVVPAGSIIRGRIAKINPPKHLSRSGSVALKFDTVTTPDNRQIPIVANLVARGGIVHAKRGLKDVVIAGSILALPAALGLGIGFLAGSSSSSSIGKGGGALIGVGVGAAVGVAILLAKKGKKVEVRPGDELKIELGEDLRMPTM